MPAGLAVGDDASMHHPIRRLPAAAPRADRSRVAAPAMLALAIVLAAGAGFVTTQPVAAVDFPSYDADYHTYPEMVDEIKATETAFPDIVALRSIGTSYAGRTLWAAKVSDNVATDEPEPEVLFDSLHHAREHLSLEQSLAVLRWLTVGYGSDERITKIVDTREVWIVFAVNPDGAAVRPRRLAVPRLAQEPPAQPRLERDRHRPQPQLRLPLGVLRRLIGQEVGLDLSRPERLLRAGDAGDARLHGQPPDRRPPADQDGDHVPHRRPADPVAVRLHQGQHARPT